MITINHLAFSYQKKQPIFSDLNLQLAPGNIYGLLGQNGAGKTTLLQLFSGLRFPQSGDCIVFNHIPQQRQPAFLSELFFISEEPHIPAVGIATFVKMYASFYPRFDQVRFDQLIQEFDIPMTDNLQQLSYGQQKKVLLSFGLATDCKLLILDEPTNGMDIPSKSRFRSLLAGSITTDRIFIISTHQVRDMANLIDPIIVLDAGQIIFQQDLKTISQHLHFEFQPVLRPPTNALYAERVAGGHIIVEQNFSNSETEIDLEVLFNTILNQRGKLEAIFQDPPQQKVER